MASTENAKDAAHAAKKAEHEREKAAKKAARDARKADHRREIEAKKATEQAQHAGGEQADEQGEQNGKAGWKHGPPWKK